MKIVALSGWGQPHDALAELLPEAQPVDYARHDALESAMAAIARAGEGAHAVVAWSLGGQMAVRAVAQGVLAPRKLVLIAAPYQFVQTTQLALGMKRDLYDKFRDNFAKSPSRTLAKAWELVAKGDARHERVRACMAGQSPQAVLTCDWLRWLAMLEGYSCASLTFTHFPPTALVHGGGDAVVEVEQSSYFKALLPHASLHVLAEAGHAPHWHDPARVRGLILEHLRA